MAVIHPTAIVERPDLLAPDADVGPFCVLRGEVRLGPGARFIASVHAQGPVTIGAATLVYPGACLGFPGQDVKFKPGDPTPGVSVGARCVLREHVTLHAATKPERPTSVGDDCYLMAYTHLGHDARIGSRVTMVSYAGLSGHAEVGDQATLGGGAGIHQFTRVGRLAFLSGGVAVSMEVPPFCLAPERNRLGGVNLVGMRRAGIPRDQITEVRRAFRDVFRASLPRGEMIEILTERGRDCPAVAEMGEFVRSAKRAICPGASRPPRLFTTYLHYARRGKALDLDALAAAEED